jgi:H+/Cl- antiporter ClcA
MHADDKIAYVSGFVMTTVMTVNWNDIFMTAVLGLIGGFFGILGKHLYFSIKNIWIIKRKKKS